MTLPHAHRLHAPSLPPSQPVRPKACRRFRPCLVIRGEAAANAAVAGSPPVVTGGNVVVVGGSGRVGANTAAALLSAVPAASISLASRSQQSYSDAVAAQPQLAAARHMPCDIDNPASLGAALRGADLVIHAAGPFQRRQDCAVLEAAIAAGVPYLDVCDDTAYSQRAKALSAKAAAAGVPAITSAGIYPGVSNVMAAHMVAIARKEYTAEWAYAASPGEGSVQPKRLLYSYYTAGTGGVGPTILDTTFLLAGEEVTAYKDGQKVLVPPVSNRRVVDFGPGVGRRSLYLYNLPEVTSSHQTLGVPSVSARFGTTDIWNLGMWLTARLAPKGLLSDRGSVRQLGSLVGPLVRAVDALVGEQVAMLVEVEFDDGKQAAGLYIHDHLPQSVGTATAAFARCMLAGQTQPGVWFPEERGALADRRALLQMAAEGTKKFVLNKPPWALETDPVQLGMGFYW